MMVMMIVVYDDDDDDAMDDYIDLTLKIIFATITFLTKFDNKVTFCEHKNDDDDEYFPIANYES